MIKQRILSFAAAVFLAFVFPASVLADDGSSPSSGTDPSASDTQAPAPDPDQTDPNTAPVTPTCPYDTSQIHGTTQPTGASASSFTYNATTCLWENDYYTWSPLTKDYTPKYDTSYVYNPATGLYETTRWTWNSAKGDYEQTVISVAPAYLLGGATVPDGASPSTTTGPNSNNGLNSNSNNSLTLNSTINVSLTNDITQQSFSGDVSVLQNTYAGNAQSGDSSDILNILNMLQASWDIQGAGDLMTFVSNINGNVTGDLLLDPSAITGPGSVSVDQSNQNNNLTVNSQENGQIDNNISLDAGSGDVDVNGNTQAGNAMSGNADAIANIVNMINSAIMAGQSFIGVININGNLDGDILLPPDFLNQLIASGAPNATVTLSHNNNTNVVANADSTQTINNNVNLNAQSGNVNSDSNTQAGDATSGSATTKLTIFNLTGRQVVGKNSLLVFVNVVGQWVGMIMDAPAGATSAALCGGDCTTSTNVNNNAALNDSQTNTINNNLDLNAKSGDVNAKDNTSVGNATSGNANASANLLNINNSSLSLSNWFGILFINVLGTWHGSFGVNTAAGNPVSGGMGGGTTPQIFKFVLPKTDGSAASVNNAVASLINQASSQQSGGQNPLVAGVAGSDGNGPTISNTVAKSSKWIIPVVSSLVGIALIGGEQTAVIIRRQNFNGRLKVGFGQAVQSLRLLLL